MLPLLTYRVALGALAGALIVCVPTGAQPSRQPMPPMDFTAATTITAQMIVDAFRPPLGTPPQLADRNMGIGYLRATKDLLPVKWCAHPRLAKNEVDGEIVGYLANLSPDERKKAAAPLIGEALVASFPCSKLKER
jgi:hypothetical protein